MEKTIIQSIASERTIHGAHYIFDRNICKVFRFYWALIFSISLFGLCYHLHGLYFKWSANPDYVTRTIWKPISEIPFPGVTICGPLYAKDDLANFDRFMKYIAGIIL